MQITLTNNNPVNPEPQKDHLDLIIEKLNHAIENNDFFSRGSDETIKMRGWANSCYDKVIAAFILLANDGVYLNLVYNTRTMQMTLVAGRRWSEIWAAIRDFDLNYKNMKVVVK